MLALTKKTGYAIVALSYLDQLPPDRLTSAREIAERFELPVALMMNVLKELSGRGYVESVRGAHGGYRLGRDLNEVNLVELVEALEGPIRLAECIGGRAGNDRVCQQVDTCPVADPVHRLHRKLVDFLRTLTLGDILQPTGEPAAGK